MGKYTAVFVEQAKVYGKAASDFISLQIEELKKKDFQEIIDNSSSEVLKVFEEIKKRPDVRGPIQSAFEAVGVNFAEKTAQEVDFFLNTTLLSIFGVLLLLVFSILLTL